MSMAERATAGTWARTTGHIPAQPAILFVACSWLLAGAAIAAAQLAHQGLHEHVELAPLVHWLRDAAVAVPMAAAAIGLGAVAVRFARDRSASPRAGSLSAWLAWAAVAAMLFAVFSIPGNQLHGLLFGAEEEEGVGWLEDALLDSGIVLLWSLVVLIPAALAGSQLWPVEPNSVQPRVSAGPAPTAPPAGPESLATTGSTLAGGDR